MFPPLPVSGQAVTLVLAAAAAVVLGALGAVAVRVPLLARLGLRNAVRRPARTVSVVAGLALSTVFITAVAGLQDSFRASAIDYRLSQVAAITLHAALGIPTPARPGHLAAALRRSGGKAAAETPARARELRRGGAARLLGELARRGPLWLAVGADLLAAAAEPQAPAATGMTLTDPAGLRILGTASLIAGCGLLAAEIAPLLRLPAAPVRRLAVTGIGIAWLIYGLHAGRPVLRAIFAADLRAAGISHTGPYSLLTILLDLVLPLAGLLVITIRNASVPGALITAAARHIPGLAAAALVAMAHATGRRARAGATVTLLATTTFLVMLLVTANGAVGGSQGGAGPYTAILTAFLTSYLALGVIFALLAIAIVTSRAVIERRHETGLLRAIGFTRPLVRRCFLLEASLTVALGQLPATALAWWLITRVTHLAGHPVPFPFLPAGLLLAGGYATALAATAVPVRTASLVPAAEALRQE